MKYELITLHGKEYYLVPVKEKNIKKVAVIAGHTVTNKGDWSNLFENYEHNYWNDFIKSYLHDVESFEHKPNATYLSRQQFMAQKTSHCDLVIELHWNAFDPDKDGKDNATGVECLVYIGNKKMIAVGKFYCSEMNRVFDLHIRGVKEISSGNGFGFLDQTKGDAIILEPFFADNIKDVATFDRKQYAEVIENVIEFYNNYE